MHTLALTLGLGLRRRSRSRYTDNIFMMICCVILIIAVAIQSPAAHVVNVGATSRHQTSSSSIHQQPQHVVISTSTPNVDNNAVIQQMIEMEARSQETLEASIAIEIAERERQLQIQREQEARIEYINSIVCDPSDITKVSGLKERDFYLLTEGTWWEGNEQALIDLEQDYGINAMFAMSVSTLESGHGTSDRASSRHNYYGIELTSLSWDSLHDNTQFWGGMMNRVYVGNDNISVWTIGPVYCPPNRNWEVYMNDNMTKLYDSLINKLTDTVY